MQSDLKFILLLDSPLSTFEGSEQGAGFRNGRPGDTALRVVLSPCSGPTSDRVGPALGPPSNSSIARVLQLLSKKESNND